MLLLIIRGWCVDDVWGRERVFYFVLENLPKVTCQSVTRNKCHNIICRRRSSGRSIREQSPSCENPSTNFLWLKWQVLIPFMFLFPNNQKPLLVTFLKVRFTYGSKLVCIMHGWHVFCMWCVCVICVYVCVCVCVCVCIQIYYVCVHVFSCCDDNKFYIINLHHTSYYFIICKMMYDVWCMKYDVRCTMYDEWCMMVSCFKTNTSFVITYVNLINALWVPFEFVPVFCLWFLADA